MLNIGIIVGSTRPNRKADVVAKWIYQIATTHGGGHHYEVIDIRDFNLPLLDEPVPPSLGRYSQAHTKRWAAKIADQDAFVFVTPEYNHATSGALKNAIDFLFAEWNNKAAGFVGYGSAGGARAIENLRLVMGEIKVADVRQAVLLSLATDFEQYTHFKPAAHQEKVVHTMLDEVIAWGEALKRARIAVSSAA
jgi:NAD(P)H-dependent FMN reductase